MCVRQRGDAPSARRPRQPALLISAFSPPPCPGTRLQLTPVDTGRDQGLVLGGQWLRSLAGCAIHRCAAPETWPQGARIMFMQSHILPAAAAWHWCSLLRLLPCPLTLPMFRLQSTNSACHLKAPPRPAGLHAAFPHAAAEYPHLHICLPCLTLIITHLAF